MRRVVPSVKARMMKALSKYAARQSGDHSQEEAEILPGGGNDGESV